MGSTDNEPFPAVTPFSGSIWLSNLNSLLITSFHVSLASLPLALNSRKWQVASVKGHLINFVCASVDLWMCSCIDPFEGIHWGRLLPPIWSPFLLVFRGTGLPAGTRLLFLAANAQGRASPFLLSSKLSLFPLLSFIICTVSSDSDTGACQLVSVYWCQPLLTEM